MTTRYAPSSAAWNNFSAHLENLIAQNGVRKILEVGGGANPTFSPDFISRHALEYTVLDISAEELAKAPDTYIKVQADITAPSLDLPGGYDLIFSKMLAEHVKSGRIFHRNVFRLLAPGGRAFHFFPTLYAPPFVANRWLPERLAELLLHTLQRGREQKGRHAKFPAYYSWCRGPLPGQFKRFEGLGYRVEEYIGFFGHEPYYARLPWIAKIHRVFSDWLVAHPTPWLTSFAYVTLVKA